MRGNFRQSSKLISLFLANKCCGEHNTPIGKSYTDTLLSVLGKFLANDIPKSVLFVIRLSIIVSGCLDDTMILISGYCFLNLNYRC